MADATAERGGAGVQWVLKSGVFIIMLAVVQVRVTGKEFEKIRHNRLSPFHSPIYPRHRLISRYQPADLGKNEYKTVSETKAKVSASRFPNLDRILNGLHQPKPSHVVTPVPDEEVSGAPIYPWAPISENPLVMELDVDLDQTLGDDFLVDDFAPETTVKSTTSTDSLEWDNNIGGESDLGVLQRDIDTRKTTSTTPSTPSDPVIPQKNTTVFPQISPTAPMLHILHHSGSVHHHRIPAILPKGHREETPAKTVMLTPHHRDKTHIIDEKRRQNEELVKLWRTHLDRTKKEVRECKYPLPKIIHVTEFYPHPYKIYRPHCTVLHRCGGDTGCCVSESQVCSPKTTQQVHLYFKTTMGNETQIETLGFSNHTECECRSKDLGTDLVPHSHRSQRHPHHPPPAPVVPTAPLCSCPSKYTVRRLADGKCMCDCFHLQKDCLKLKRGKDYFSRADQLCIKNETCLKPSCEYGSYLPKNARCVKKTEMFSHWPKYSVQDVDS